MRDLETVKGRLKFVLVPTWLEEIIADTNFNAALLVTDPMKLSDILSKYDVEKYMNLNQYCTDVLSAVGLDDRAVGSAFLNQDERSYPGYTYPDYDRPYPYKDSKHYRNSLLFDYFNDSNLITEDNSLYYYEIVPLHDDIMGIYIRMADIDSEIPVKDLQKDALRDWLIYMNRYVSFKEIAKSGFLKEYLGMQ